MELYVRVTHPVDVIKGPRIGKKKSARGKRVVRTMQHHATHAHHETWHVCTHARVCHAVMQRAEPEHEVRIARRVESLGKSTTHTRQTTLAITQTTHTTRKCRQHARTARAALCSQWLDAPEQTTLYGGGHVE
jgi:uncharacterized membrane protein